MSSPETMEEQVSLVVQKVLETLEDWGEREIHAIGARGGFVPRPSGKLQGGTYTIVGVTDGKVRVDRQLVKGIIERPEKEHASNLGIPVAAALAEMLGVPAFTVDKRK